MPHAPCGDRSHAARCDHPRGRGADPRPPPGPLPRLAAAGGVLALIPDAAGLPTGPAPCGPCDPTSVPSIDRAALHNASDGATTASSVLLLGVAGFSGLASLEGATAAQVRGHVAVFANSLTWTLATTEWLKVLVHRNRPVLYGAPDPI